MSDMVWVEVNENGVDFLRIFKSEKLAFALGGNLDWVLYDVAVKNIRHQLWLRCGGFCELCGSVVTESSGHMHEQTLRGKGGEISMANSVFICPISHKIEHKNRNPRWNKKPLTS